MKMRPAAAVAVLLLGFGQTSSAVQIPQVAPEIRARAENLSAQPLKAEYQYTMTAFYDPEEVVIVETSGENVVFEDRREGRMYIDMTDGTRTWPRQEGKLIEVDGKSMIEKTKVSQFRFWQKGEVTLAEEAHETGSKTINLWAKDLNKEVTYAASGKIFKVDNNARSRPYSVLPFLPSIYAGSLSGNKMKEEQVVENEPGKFLYTARDGESTIEFEATNHANPIAIRRVAGPLPGEESSETIYEGEQEFEGFLMPTAVETNKYDKDHHKKISNRASDIRISRITDEEFAAIEEEYRSIKKE